MTECCLHPVICASAIAVTPARAQAPQECRYAVWLARERRHLNGLRDTREISFARCIAARYAPRMSPMERDAAIRARLAKLPEMTPAERAQQRESFAYGNLKVDDPTLPVPASLTRR